jgi:hypothetical protein
MKPRTIETISPPRALPAIAFPRAPQTAAITRRSRSEGSDIVMAGSFQVLLEEREHELRFSTAVSDPPLAEQEEGDCREELVRSTS